MKILLIYLIGVLITAAAWPELRNHDKKDNLETYIKRRNESHPYIHKVKILKRIPRYMTAIYNNQEEDDDSNEIFNDLLKKKKNEDCAYMYCQAEDFQHYIRTSDNKVESTTNRWKMTKVGYRGSLVEICLKRNGVPLTRKCLCNKETQQAVWESTSKWSQVECLRYTRERIVTKQLNTIHEQVLEGKAGGFQGRKEIADSLLTALNEPNHKMLPADVDLTSKILQEMSTQPVDVELAPQVLSMCNTMMSTDAEVLRLSADVDATNNLLEGFENYMDNLSTLQVPQEHCGKPSNVQLMSANSAASSSAATVENMDYTHLGVKAHISANVSVFFVNPLCSHITGIAVYQKGKHNHLDHRLISENVGNFLYRFVYMNETAAALIQENGLEVASFVPTSLWQHINEKLWASGHLPLLVFKIYSHDGLFVEKTLERVRKPFSKILSISIPKYEGNFPEELPFLLRNQNHEYNIARPSSGCGYWDYNTWISTGVTTTDSRAYSNEVMLCTTTHLTQFSFLVGGNFKQNDLSGDILISEIHLQALDIITLLGCSLSLLGLVGIWITAAFQSSWRSLPSTKILLHLCVALTLQMILFVFVNTDDLSERLIDQKSYGKCIAMGALLQYFILVLFCWMLIVAFLQFQRYVTIIGIERPPHYILKSAIAAWGFPLIPTILVVCIDPHSYIPTEYQLRTDSGVCYPSGYGLTFGVLLPVSLIVIANLAIFIYVFYSISHSLSKSMQHTEKQYIYKQIRLSILLFFLLGLSWIFGIFAFMHAGIAFSYLFCLTATLQGFVLFIYFVILDETVRGRWVKLLCPARAKKQAEKRANELQSMTTSSTNNFSSNSNAAK